MAALSPRPKARRQYGTGSVFQRSSDGRWIGVIQAGWTDRGTRRTIRVSASTEPEVKRRLRDRAAELERDGLADADTSRATVKTWAERWLAIIEHEVKPTTYTTHRSMVRRWIVPTIGHRHLANLTPGDIRNVATAQRDAGNADASVLRAHTTLMRMLRAAQSEGYVIPARVLAVKAPAKGISDRDAATTDDAITLLRAAGQHPDGSRWVAALLQGMRQGECLGLTWDQVDLDAGTLEVSWQLRALPYRDVRDKSRGFRVPAGYEHRQVEGALHLTRPKTSESWRVIPLVEPMAVALRAWAQVAPANPLRLVWTRPDGRPWWADDDRARWYALQASVGVQHPAGRPYHVHEARHTTATLLLEAGVDPHVVRAIMGHSSIVTSRGYQHVRGAAAKTALEQVASALKLTGDAPTALPPADPADA